MSPELTVVLSAWRDPGALDEALDALAPQRDDRVEVLVVSDLPRPASIDSHPWVTWLEAPWGPHGGPLTPELWSLGVARARGEIVALTTSRMVPEADWLARIRGALGRLAGEGVVAVGGAIDPPPRSAPAADWATYLLRYGAHLGREREMAVDDLAADNAAYHRGALEEHRDAWLGGFWEPELHHRMRAAGQGLVFVPGIRVRQGAGFGAWRFCGQRLRHGRRYGADRWHGRSLPVRLAAVAAAPLVPLLLVLRVARRTLAHGEHRLPLLRALAWLAVFAKAWALGEVWGNLAPPPANDGAPETRSS